METGFYHIRHKNIIGWSIGYYNSNTDRWNVPELRVSNISSESITQITKPIPCSKTPLDAINSDSIMGFVDKAYSAHGVPLEGRWRRDQGVLFVRMAIIFCLRNYTHLPYKRIGGFMRKDHATIIHSMKKHDYYLRKNKIYKEIFESVILIYNDHCK